MEFGRPRSVASFGLDGIVNIRQSAFPGEHLPGKTQINKPEK
jgi:hypothetical protein